MDNASKALIIAGAVLIAVMLVSVGVLVYNNSIGVIKTGLDIESFFLINNDVFRRSLKTEERSN